jgi:non-specific serine/threonine protein kinase
LPVPLTSFVGRHLEVVEVRELLKTTRLLTLTGVGGVGKTRLALEVATSSGAEYQAGAALVELAALADPALVPQAVASVLGVPEQPGRPMLHTVLSALRRRPVLLVLDNCEHLVQACAELAESVLRACPDVRILGYESRTARSWPRDDLAGALFVAARGGAAGVGGKPEQLRCRTPIRAARRSGTPSP